MATRALNGLDLDGHRVQNVGAATDPDDATTLGQVRALRVELADESAYDALGSYDPDVLYWWPE
ncbi:hypothetical protein [Hoyosella altamirensis]|uniref:Uncharacterized protein n=1 Tax=Hoyosella altamirensis TaxID=616997 RepID=A0A839RUA2_9ACTN|nr:hypothetical protein [Hoyosella altamirensis]MBB3039806.1 hypothetical protein [Hoyosella altamirensis]